MLQNQMGNKKKNGNEKNKTKKVNIYFKTDSKTVRKMVPKLKPNLVQNRNLPQDFCCVNETRQKHDPKNGVTIVNKSFPNCDQKLFDDWRLASFSAG